MYKKRNTEGRSCYCSSRGKKSYNCYIFCVWVCSLTYTECEANGSYCHLWPLRLLTYFPHIVSQTAEFSKRKLLKKMCGLNSSTNLSGKFLIGRKIQPHVVMNVHKLSCKLPIILVRFERNLNFP
jgi:hypothetical protein